MEQRLQDALDQNSRWVDERKQLDQQLQDLNEQ